MVDLIFEMAQSSSIPRRIAISDGGLPIASDSHLTIGAPIISDIIRPNRRQSDTGARRSAQVRGFSRGNRAAASVCRTDSINQ